MATITVEAKPEIIVTFGQYKEQFAGPATYSKQAEEEGGEGVPKAAVRQPLLALQIEDER